MTLRQWALIVVLVQAIFFFLAMASNPHYLYSDNIFYEMPAWNLAQGRGFTISRADWEDPYLTRAFAARHPEADLSDIPAVVFPPGYGFFLAAVYAVAGARSHSAAILANGLLMALNLGGLMILARKGLGDSASRKVFLVLCAVFPFWAYWAARMMSDTLHTTLLTGAILLWLSGAASWPRSLGVGFLMGLATLTRPYTLALPLMFGVWWVIGRRGWRAVAGAACVALVSGLMTGAWMIRNQLDFGEPLVVSLTKGQGLWQATHYEAEAGAFANHDYNEVFSGLEEAGIVDAYRYEDNRKLRDLALARIREAPIRHLLRTFVSLPRLWIPIGGSFGPGIKGLLIAWFGLLLLALLYGLKAAIRSTNPVLEAALIIVAYYTFIFWLPGHVESRYVLPARGFSFLLIAAAFPPAKHAFRPEA